MFTRRIVFLTAGLAALCVAAQFAEARVKLITLPVRERVEVQLDNPAATLIEEERVVPLVQGVNQVDFSWKGTRIDPGTIVFRVVGPAAGNDGLTANVLSVSYPPGENALVWQVAANKAGSVRVRISYLLGGLNRSFNYRAVANQDETALTFRQYVRVQNFANEAFKDTNIFIGFGEEFRKQIGLNETKELLVEKFTDIPVEKTYTVNASQFGYLNRAQDKLNVTLHYVLTNDQKNKLGKAALPAGKVRIFQRDHQGTTAFLGEDWGAFTPVGDKMRLYLGLAQDVVTKRKVTDRKSVRVVGNVHDRSVTVKYELENFKDKPVTLRIVEQTQLLVQDTQGGVRSPWQWKIQSGGADDISPRRVTDDPDETNLGVMTFEVPVPAADADGKPGKATYNLTVKFKNNF